MNPKTLKIFAMGMFYSTLSYCLPIFGNVFCLEQYKEENRRYVSYTMKDNNKLQILQNKVNRLLLSADSMTSTKELLQRTDSLSIHQTIAYQTAVMTLRIVQSEKPSYLADKMKPRHNSVRLRAGIGKLTVPPYKLSVSREGFVYRGAYLYNMLHEKLRIDQNASNNKKYVKMWVKVTIQ